MKRAKYLFLLLFFLLTACGGQASQSGGIKVVATTTMIGDVVANIGGEEIDLTVLLPVGVDPHAFQPVPQDIAAISEADVVFINGLDLEEFLESILANTPVDVEIIDLSQGIDAIGRDPHVWMDVENVILWTDTIANSLAELDVGNAKAYFQNAKNYQVELISLDSMLVEELGAIPLARRVMVTDHDAFLYFARAYDVTLVGAVIPSFSTLAEPSAQELAALQNAIREIDAPAVFVGTTISPSIVQRVAEDTGMQLVTLYTGSLSEPDGPAGTYIQMMQFNLNAILEALR